jgi:hypothetical protein
MEGSPTSGAKGSAKKNYKRRAGKDDAHRHAKGERPVTHSPATAEAAPPALSFFDSLQSLFQPIPGYQTVQNADKKTDTQENPDEIKGYLKKKYRRHHHESDSSDVESVPVPESKSSRSPRTSDARYVWKYRWFFFDKKTQFLFCARDEWAEDRKEMLSVPSIHQVKLETNDEGYTVIVIDTKKVRCNKRSRFANFPQHLSGSKSKTVRFELIAASRPEAVVWVTGLRASRKTFEASIDPNVTALQSQFRRWRVQRDLRAVVAVPPAAKGKKKKNAAPTHIIVLFVLFLGILVARLSGGCSSSSADQNLEGNGAYKQL